MHPLLSHLSLYFFCHIGVATICFETLQFYLTHRPLHDPLFLFCAHHQGVLLLLALFSVPVLLLAKPLTIRSRMNKAAARHDSFSSESQLMGGEPTSGEKVDNGHAAGGDHGGGGHEEHDFSEIVIHQVQRMPRSPVEPCICVDVRSSVCGGGALEDDQRGTEDGRG